MWGHAQGVAFVLNLVVVFAFSLNIDTTNYSLQDYKSFLDNYWETIKTLEANTHVLSIRKTADLRTELAFTTQNGFKYHFFPVSTAGSIDFKVKAAKDVHIAFTTDPYDLDPIIEESGVQMHPSKRHMFRVSCDSAAHPLPFGVQADGWQRALARILRQTICHARLTPVQKLTTPNVLEVETPEILSADEFHCFRLRWNHGNISAWRLGEPRPFISWLHREPFKISYLGVRTSWGANGSWVIKDLNINNAEQSSPDSDAYLHFKVRARNDAHVGLFTTNSLTGPVIEIAIGGWSNKRSVIRRGNPTPTDKVGVDIPDFLNGSEYRGFWLKWGRVISVGREGDACPFISWTDPEPFQPKYVGVHTGFGSVGDWKIEDLPDLYTPDNTEYKFIPVEQVTPSVSKATI